MNLESKIEKITKLREAGYKVKHTEIGEVFRVLELIRTLNNLRKNEAVDDDEFLSLKDFIIRKVDPVYKLQREDDEQILDNYEKSKTRAHNVVEKDSLFDESEYNRLANKVGKFKDDFERVNVSQYQPTDPHSMGD